MLPLHTRGCMSWSSVYDVLMRSLGFAICPKGVAAQTVCLVHAGILVIGGCRVEQALQALPPPMRAQ